jgi:uncharacterized protein YndB with AHSA1/START domain
MTYPGSDHAKGAKFGFSKEYEIGATVDRVWLALVDPTTIEAWSGGPAAMGISPGSSFSMWAGHLWGSVLRTQPGHLLELAWCSVDMQQNEPTIVTMRLKGTRFGTEVALDHDGIEIATNARSFAAGWDERFFGPLKTFVERSG